MKRQVFLDTETTGLKPPDHRVIEIGCVEVVNRKLTGEHYHVYINPEREVDPGAYQVHGIDYNQLKDKPLFKDIVEEFLQFIKGAEILIHNAPFDVGFLNSEFIHIEKDVQLDRFCEVTDTLKLARKLRPRQRNSLDALCQFYGVENAHRTLHGALLDAELLAKMYLEMTAGQHNFDMGNNPTAITGSQKQNQARDQRTQAIMHLPTAEELTASEEFEDIWK